jgi:hypothetical protein
LARSLGDLSLALSEVDRDEEAAAASEEAVAIWRQLVGSNTAHRTNLALALNNLAIDMGVLGQDDRGLALYDEALGIRRDRVAKEGSTHLPDLAGSDP